MSFRARLLLAILIFSALPLAYVLQATVFQDPLFAVAIFAVCVFALLGALAGALQIDGIVRQKEDRATRSEVELQTFTERVHDGIFRVDASGKVREINTAMAECLRQVPEFLKGRRLWDYLVWSGGVPDAAFIPAGQLRRTVLMLGKRKTGDSVTLQVDLYGVQEAGAFAGFRGCARLAPAPLQEAALKARFASESFQAAQNLLQDHLSRLLAILGSGLEPRQLAPQLETETNQMRSRCAGLFEKGALTAWTPQLCVDLVDPRALLENVRARFEPAAALKKLQFSVSSAGSSPSFLGDRAHLAELLDDLVANAIKYTLAGNGVSLDFSENEEGYDFVVQDGGIGIPQSEQSCLFTPFFRGENAVNASIGGLGLGLWTAQKIAQAHKGILFVESRLHQGTTVTFRIVKRDRGTDTRWVG
ncbi:MAG: ATP-binding protein [Elusimicrobia bacterium]|nr:ATP-binding protein [Elusimicrobiota bacterium]